MAPFFAPCLAEREASEFLIADIVPYNFLLADDVFLMRELQKDDRLRKGCNPSLGSLTIDGKDRGCFDARLRAIDSAPCGTMGHWVAQVFALKAPAAPWTEHTLEQCKAAARAIQRGGVVPRIHGVEVSAADVAGVRVGRVSGALFVLEVTLTLRRSAIFRLRKFPSWYFGLLGEVQPCRVDTQVVLARTGAVSVDPSPFLTTPRPVESVRGAYKAMERPVRVVEGVEDAPLLSFQAQTVEFMEGRETDGLALFRPLPAPDEDVLYSPLLNLFVPVDDWPSPVARGGMITTEYGMGKTVIAATLMARRPGRTLVVTKVTLLHQWRTELRRFAPDLRVVVHHGPKRHYQASTADADVIVTSYGILRSDRNREGGPLRRPFRRAVFDESHTLKHANTVTWRAAVAVQADAKWCLSATPIETSFADAFGQFGVIFDGQFTKPMWDAMFILSKSTFGSLLRTLSWRNTRQQRYTDDETPLVDDCTVKSTRKHFHRLADHVAYESHCREYRACASLSMGELIQEVERRRKHCAFGFSLKRLCDRHIVPSVEEFLDERDCPICLSVPTRPVVGRCGHVLCFDCCQTLLLHTSQCPLCRADYGTLRELVEEEEVLEETEQQPSADSKVAVVWALLSRLLEDEQRKIVVFSQYLPLLKQLTAAAGGCAVAHFHGGSSVKRRQQCLDAFQRGEARVLFLSLRSSSCGINLQDSTDVVLCEPIINKKIMAQAVHRIHRIGGAEETNVHRVVCEGTIEQRIDAMQDVVGSFRRATYERLLLYQPT